MKKLIIALTLFAITHVTPVQAAAGWTHNLEVCQVQTSGGYYYLSLCGAYTPRVCGKANWVKWHPSIANSDEIYSTALLALALDKKISVYAIPETDCANVYDSINAIRIVKG